MLKDTLSMSERLACKAVGLARSTYRNLPMALTPSDPDADMRVWLRSSSLHLFFLLLYDQRGPSLPC